MKKSILLIGILFFVCSAVIAQSDWKVGDKVEAGPGAYHNAIILAVSPSKSYYRLHYDDGAFPDNNWLSFSFIRARNTQAKTDVEEAKGPRNGKYLIYIYMQGTGTYYGYFNLSGGSYEMFSLGGKSIGKGTYKFDKSTKKVKWDNGPFTEKGWDGTQQFEVSREGKTHIIRLRGNTIGTNSTDSK